MTKEYITFKEASKILEVQHAAIWLFIKNEHLKAITLACGEYLLKKSDVKRLQIILLRKEKDKELKSRKL